MFDGEVEATVLYQIRGAALPVSMQEGPNASRNDWTRRAPEIIFVAAPEVVIDPDVEANQPRVVLCRGAGGAGPAPPAAAAMLVAESRVEVLRSSVRSREHVEVNVGRKRESPTHTNSGEALRHLSTAPRRKTNN